MGEGVRKGAKGRVREGKEGEGKQKRMVRVAKRGRG